MQNPSTPLVKNPAGGRYPASLNRAFISGAVFPLPRRRSANFAGARRNRPRVGRASARADTFSAASWQDIEYCRELGGGDPGRFSEDCLYLNVWAPAGRAQPLPVMVWLHGGGFTIGAGSLPPYDGKALAARDVVVVTVNYRAGGIWGSSPIRRWKGKTANESIISPSLTKLPRCNGCRIIFTLLAATPPTSPCLASRPGRAACSR